MKLYSCHWHSEKTLLSVEGILPSPVERQNAGVKSPVVSHTHVCPLYIISHYEKAGTFFF